VNGPTYKYTIGRIDLKVKMMGVEMTTNIGLNSRASFACKLDDAQIAGDIAMLPGEVPYVIRALRKQFISLESDKGKGSNFTIHIPLS
jgi:hypothetical protein